MDKRVDRIIKQLIDDGYTVNKYETRKKDDAMYETIKATKEDWDILVVSGGDGTVNEVAKGIALGERKLPVAILAAGTVNDFANFMKIPKDPDSFVEMIERARTVDVDLGVVNDHYFVNVVAGGFLANVGYQVPIEAKFVLGRMAYYLDGLKELATTDFTPMELKVVSEEYTGVEEALLFLISNSSSVGGFKKLAPNADVVDGLLDMIIIKKSDVGDLANIFFSLLRGEHINHPNVIYFKSKEIEVSTKERLVIDIDGEYGGELPGKFSVLPNAFRILT